MAEKRVAAIESVTLDTATFTAETFHPTYINFFYGKNGTGKTSLGRQLGNKTGICWAEGEAAENYEIHLYNQDFNDTYFHTLDKVQGVFTLSEGPETEETEKRIKALEERARELEKRKAEIEREDDGELAKNAKCLQNAQSRFQETCLRNTRTLYEKFKPAFKGASRNPQLSQKIISTAPKDCDEAELKTRCDTTFAEGAHTYPYLTELDGEKHIAAIPDCALLGEEIVSKGTTEYAKFIGALGALSWVEEGHQKYHETADGLCPYCRQPLPADFETRLASCYDEEYRQKVKQIETFRDRYNAHMNTVYRIMEQAQNAETMPSLTEKLASLTPQVDNFLRAFQSAATTIEQKLKNPALPVQLENLQPLLLGINSVIHSCNTEIEKNNDVVAKLRENKEQCEKDVWALAAWRLQGEAETFRKAQADSTSKRNRLNEELEAIRKEMDEIRGSLDTLGSASTTIQAAITAMNRILRDSGFEGFEIVKSDMAKDAYKVVRRDKQVAVRLSDGERHFLSFLYFYYRVKGCNANGVQKDKIVIIDDPVSSLDDNALFIISSLVREMIEVCYNNTDYRRQTVKGDYIKQLFILTHNAPFHRGITYNQVGRYSCVNFYRIVKENNHSKVIPCTQPSKTEAGEYENFNPIKNAYAALWAEYQVLDKEIPLMNVIHRILDFYFLDICGRDGLNIRDEILVKNRDKFVEIKEDGSEDRTLFHLADSMLQYMGAGVEGSLYYISDGADVQEIKRAFEMIFRRLGQGEHYDMMMERARTV